MPRRLPTTAASLALALCGVFTVAACDSGASSDPNSGGTPSAQTTGPLPSVSPCVKPAKAAVVWPDEFPADIPKPTGATITKRQHVNGGVILVQMIAPYSLREGVVFILGRYPASGYVLGRGDAENTEADAPFARGDIRGLVKVVIDPSSECRTTWLVAVASSSNANSPYLHYSTGPSPSPLPFG